METMGKVCFPFPLALRSEETALALARLMSLFCPRPLLNPVESSPSSSFTLNQVIFFFKVKSQVQGGVGAEVSVGQCASLGLPG